MGAGFLFSILIWLILILLILIWLFISFKKKRKFGIIVSSIFFLILISFYFSNDIEELTFGKEEVKNDLKNLNITFNDDFKIIDNKISGMPERYQDTKLLISKKDRNKIIYDIKNSKNFKKLKNEKEIINNSEEILNFKYPDFYSKEILKKNDNYPTKILIFINDNCDTINYQRIED